MLMMKKEKEEERMLREENACDAVHDACFRHSQCPFIASGSVTMRFAEGSDLS